MLFVDRNNGFEVNFVAPQIAISGSFALESVDWLAQELGIRGVVDVRDEESDDRGLLAKHSIRLLHLPTPDTKPLPLSTAWLGIRWIQSRLEAGHKVLIHCQHGIGRSALLACMVLVCQGRTLVEALEIIKEARPKVSPSPDQLKGLLAWMKDYCSEAGRRDDATYDDLAKIAYRHLQNPGKESSGEAA